MSSRKHLGSLLGLVLALVCLFSLLPLGSALEFGEDEGFELMKGLLCSKGFSLYREVWNDQPPVYTMALRWAFSTWGPSILTARLVAAGFGLLLFVVFYQLVRQRLGLWGALLATFLLLASPVVLLLSVSVMLEVPALATALLSAWLLMRWGKQPHWGWLLASGSVLGIALGIKLTAIVVMPALLVEVALKLHASRKPDWRRAVPVSILGWAGAALLTFMAILLLWGSGSLQSSWRSHATSQPVAGIGQPGDYGFQSRLLVSHAESVAAALVGIVLIARQKRWREFAFPLVFLSTAVTIHSIHRPWWNYYYLHLAIPLAWLAGFGIEHLLRTVIGYLSTSGFRLSARATWQGMLRCGLVTCVLARAEARLESSAKDLRQRPRVASSALVAKMKEQASQTKWIFAPAVIYPFHAQLPVPPELAVIMGKRFWSGQITPEEIIEVCRRYQPEQLVLSCETDTTGWQDLLDTHYTLAYQDSSYQLYVVKRLRRGIPKAEGREPKETRSLQSEGQPGDSG